MRTFKIFVITCLFVMLFMGKAFAGGLTTITLDTGLRNSQISSNGEQVWLGRNREVAILSLAGNSVRVIDNDSETSQIARSKTGRLFATAHNNLQIKIWQADGTLARAIQVPGNAAILALEFSPDEKFIMTGTGNFRPIQVWSLATGEIAWEFPGSFASPHVTFSPNGKQLIQAFTTSMAGGMVKVWDLRTGTVVNSWETAGGMRSVAISPDGKRLATATVNFITSETTTTVWNLKGKALKVIPHQAKVTTVSFSPKGELATGDSASTVRLFTKKYKLIQEEVVASVGQWTEVRDITFSANGKRIAIANISWFLTIWDR